MAISGATYFARVRFLPCMGESMFLQIFQSSEGLAASFAVIIGFACVRSDVRLEGARFGKGGAAKVTDERPVAGVRSLVIDTI